MSPYHPHLLARPVPRYTSYPTAAEFGDSISQRDMLDALSDIPAGENISLYVHIPFCREICAYCGCNTGRANRAHRLQSYLDALDAEIDLVARALAGRGHVRRITFGGGSPNALEPLAFVRLVDRLLVRFAATAPDFSIELDPRSLNRDWFTVIGAIGVGRASLGVQTFDSRLQAAIGRIQADDLIERAVEGLRAAGVWSLNFDLMYGLPGQTLAHVSESAERSIALGADRVALFGYAHLPALIHRQRRICGDALPDPSQRFEQAETGRRTFEANGYRRVGFDHFARPHDPMAVAAQSMGLHRNFQGFTDDDSTTLIGLGASAISQFPSAIIQNEKQPGRYRMLSDAGILPAQRGIRLNPDMRARAAIIEALLCYGKARPSPLLLQQAIPALSPFLEHDLIRLEGGQIVLSADAWPYARVIASAFDAYRTSSQGQFSHAV